MHNYDSNFKTVSCAISLAAAFALSALSGDARSQNTPTPAHVFADSALAQVYDIEFLANASRLQAAAAGRAVAWAREFKRVRIGNLYVGSACVALGHREAAIRTPTGAVLYQFDDIIRDLDLIVRSGLKPVIALTGLPRALVPPGEEVQTHPAYGCVNGPAIDWTQSEPRARMREWWDLQAALFRALKNHFGDQELRLWEFATWTEPYNPRRSPQAHLYYSGRAVPPERYDEAVATLLATTIDAAMEAGVAIHIGNFAGDVREDYPKVMRAIRNFPRGERYLDYITGYAVSRYRVKPEQKIGDMVKQAAMLAASPEMPRKPIFVDELGQLADDTGAAPPKGLDGLESSAFVASALHELFAAQSGSPLAPRRVAFWNRASGAREMDSPPLPAAADNLRHMFQRLNGTAPLKVEPGELRVTAGRHHESVYMVATAASNPMLCAIGPTPEFRVVVSGLKPKSSYSISLETIDRIHGNPSSAYMNDAPSYLCSRNVVEQRNRGYSIISPTAQRCVRSPSNCPVRAEVNARATPLRDTINVTTDSSGALTLPLRIVAGGAASVELTPKH